MATLRLLCLALLIGTGCSPAAPTTNSTDVISIASDFPLSGPFNFTSLQEAVAFAVARTGPIGGYRLAWRSFDNALAGSVEPVKGVQNVEHMLQDPTVLGMVGPGLSVVAREEIPIASAGKLAMVSPTSTFNCLTLSLPGCRLPSQPGGNSFFRIAAPDALQGTAMADLAFTMLGLRRVAVLRESGPSEYGANLAASFTHGFRRHGGDVFLDEQFDSTTNDFSESLHRIALGGGQAIYVAGAPALGACRIRAQMGGILPEGTYFLGGDALIGGGGCIIDAGSAANEQMIATQAVPPPNLDDPRAKDYLKTHPKANGGDFAAYDCVLILMDAIRRAFQANYGKLPGREQVRAAVAKTAQLKGITGTWSFDAQGDATVPGMSFYRVQGRSWTFWTSVHLANVAG